MKENFDQSFAYVMENEGGFVNDPDDPGGMTNHGVTKATYEAYVGHSVSESDMRSLTVDGVKPLYKTGYWDKVAGDEMPSGVDYALMDYAVNSGVSHAVKALQAALNVPADGVLGPLTLKSAQEANPVSLVDKLCQARLQFLQGLNTFNKFGKGWTTRVNQVKDRAHDMARV